MSDSPSLQPLTLLAWLRRVVEVPNVRIQVRTRGNNLYILYEAAICPDRTTVFANLVRSLAQIEFRSLLSANQSSVYQVVVYGRAQRETRPQWAEVIHLDQLPAYLEVLEPSKGENLKSENLKSENLKSSAAETGSRSAMIVSNFSLAKQGRPEAIARYLSEAFTQLGIAVRASVRSVVLPDDAKYSQLANVASVFTSQNLTQTSLLRRLWVLCECSYSPDPSLIAVPIAQKLRELELIGFRDAIVFSQVNGEPEPDWTLRVDLTPPTEMLKDWARWGDVEALTRLLNRRLADQQVQVSLDLMDITIHVSCQGKTVPDKPRLLDLLRPTLEEIAPQGIHCATIYGIGEETEAHADEHTPSPAWVEWLNLPAAQHPALADSTESLATHGDLSAIAFQLMRSLNPNLEEQLATGGIQVQIRQRDDLMHVMTDAPTCPPQQHVTMTVSEFLKRLNLAEIQGARVYGRRAGQSRPLWSYGVDFVDRGRMVPEATPEFAASDAYVGDLLSTDPTALTVRPDLTAADVKTFGQRVGDRMVEGVQWLLVRSQLFTLEMPVNLSVPAQSKSRLSHERKVAVVWTTLGLLLTLQSDWVLGQLMQTQMLMQPTPSAAPSPIAPPSEQLQLPQLSLQKTAGLEGQSSKDSGFNGSGFVQNGQSVMSTEAPRRTGDSDEAPKALMASPLRPKAAVDATRSPYPTFNAKQLDEKLVLYRQYVSQFGAPDVLIIGSSRAMRGIDPQMLQQTLGSQGFADLKIFNFGVNGATAQVVDLIVRRILPSEKMPRLILFADGSRAFNSGRSDATYAAIASSPGFKKLPDASTASVTATSSPTAAFSRPLETISQTNSVVADSYQTLNNTLNQTIGNVSTVYKQREKLVTFLRDEWRKQWGTPPIASEGDAIALEGQGLIDINGFLPIPMRFNPATYYQKYSRVPGNSDGDYANFSLDGAQHDALQSMAEFLKSQNIPLVVVNLPLTDMHLDSFRREREQKFQQQMMQTAVEMGFTFRDLSIHWTTENDFFSDPSHLNRYGAYAVAQHLAKDPLIPWVKRQ